MDLSFSCTNEITLHCLMNVLHIVTLMIAIQETPLMENICPCYFLPGPLSYIL